MYEFLGAPPRKKIPMVPFRCILSQICIYKSLLTWIIFLIRIGLLLVLIYIMSYEWFVGIRSPICFNRTFLLYFRTFSDTYFITKFHLWMYFVLYLSNVRIVVLRMVFYCRSERERYFQVLHADMLYAYHISVDHPCQLGERLRERIVDITEKLIWRWYYKFMREAPKNVVYLLDTFDGNTSQPHRETVPFCELNFPLRYAPYQE